MKKKVAEKLDKIKALFTEIGVDVDDKQVESFVNIFELQKKDAITEAVKPYEEKLADYQKRNYELGAALEESKQFSNKFEKFIEAKIKELDAIKFPEVPKIEEAIVKVIKEKMDLLEKKIVKIDEAANKVNEKILPLKLDEELKKVSDIGTLFANYKDEFGKHLVELESSDIKKLKEELATAKTKLAELEKKNAQLQEQIVKERANTEITILLENSSLDKLEKEHLWKYYEKTNFDEGKSEIEKFISLKENKEKERPPVQRSFVVRENSGGIKPMNETGVLQKKRLLGESTSFSREMDEWAELSKVDELPKV
jgi:hypothetical protein